MTARDGFDGLATQLLLRRLDCWLKPCALTREGPLFAEYVDPVGPLQGGADLLVTAAGSVRGTTSVELDLSGL